MTPTYKESASDREILLVGPYGVLGAFALACGYLRCALHKWSLMAG
jgi:hypothetical protein